MCTSVDSMFTTLEAGLQSANVVLSSVELAIPEPVIVAVEGGVTIAINGLAELKSVYDTYEADNTNTGIIGDIQAGVAAVQADLQGIETAAHIDNAAVQAWLSKIVGLAGTVLKDVVTEVLPVVKEIHERGTVSLAEAKAINASMKTFKKNYVADWDVALESANFPEPVAKRAHDGFHHAIAPHVIGVRV